jgi:hypothetical protein
LSTYAFTVDGVDYYTSDELYSSRQNGLASIKEDGCVSLDDGSHRLCLSSSSSDAARWTPNKTILDRTQPSYAAESLGLLFGWREKY